MDGGGTDSGGAAAGSGVCGSIVASGVGCAGTGGVTPVLALTGCPTPNAVVTLSLTNGKSDSTALVFVGIASTMVPMQNGCKLLVAPTLPLEFQLDSAGGFTQSLDLPFDAPLGTAWLQAFVADSGVPQQFSNTNRVMFTIE